jgi:hypothetical protein
MGQAGEPASKGTSTVSTCVDTTEGLQHRAGGRPATAVARLGRSPLWRASLFRQIVERPG